MKTQIDIITGFLDSGKTTYINGLIKESKYLKEKIVIIQCENGEIEIDKHDSNIYVTKCSNEESINDKLLMEVIKNQSPDRIIIEYNGTWNIQLLLDSLDYSILRKHCLLDKIIHVIDVNTFEIFINNMGAMFTQQISQSDTIVLNKTDKFSHEKLEGIKKSLKTLNKSAKIFKCVKTKESNNKLVCESFNRLTDFPKTKFDKLFLAFTMFIIGYVVFSLIKGEVLDLSNLDLSRYQAFSTVFISILMQAFPFILIGVFISAIFQVLVPEELIFKVFPKNPFLAFFVSIIAGVFFPICDCAIIPIAGKLVKKGVPIYCAVTFLLAAPIVDPVVIASTLYAFPGNPRIAIYRVIIGITVAVSVGIITLIFGQRDNVLLDKINNKWCGCEACNVKNIKNKSVFNKIYLIFNHAGSEFLMVGRFLIVGAFLSVLAQTYLPHGILERISSEGLGSIMIMMGAAFFLSICSTSDAFIARSFTNHFPMSSVMGFMVMGAMIDIKNVFLLLGTFKKRFVIELLITILALSFSIITIFTLLLF
ncbi:permease [Herbivorax sp. ANBcel31]|uniref:permease n=1 Tax=Herbivorax sp. ANBcel31 TaxID=3069754 RepID=UPI0027B5AF3D|nr:permease [Herbivorax sp. ANBcel31]MDQ2087636.1 permease [Herbivorax sp. ANBcel31]